MKGHWESCRRSFPGPNPIDPPLPHSRPPPGPRPPSTLLQTPEPPTKQVTEAGKVDGTRDGRSVPPDPTLLRGGVNGSCDLYDPSCYRRSLDPVLPLPVSLVRPTPVPLERLPSQAGRRSWFRRPWPWTLGTG